MSVLLETCHCGHHKDTHFESAGACLGMRCDDCKAYRDASKPDTRKAPPRRPAHASWCECFGCREYAAWERANWGT